MTQQNVLELAKQGDPQAITTLMNRVLAPKGITAKVAIKDGYLQIILESDRVPEQQALVAFIRKGITGLELKFIKTVKIYGRQIGAEFPAWSERFELMAKKTLLTINRGSVNQERELQKQVTPSKANEPRSTILGAVILVVIGGMMFGSCQPQSRDSPASSSQECYENASRDYVDSTLENEGNHPVSESDINRYYNGLKQIHEACQ